jgi:hypothetical protein
MYPEEGQLRLLPFYCATVAPILPAVLLDLNSTVDETLRRHYHMNGVLLQCLLYSTSRR